MFVDRVFARVAGVDQQLGEAHRLDVLSGAQFDGAAANPVDRAHARQHRGRRGDDDAHEAAGEAVQRASAGGRDFEVRRQAAIGVDFLRRKRQHLPLGLGLGPAFECGQEEPKVLNDDVEVAVARDDDQARLLTPRRRDRQRLGRPG